MDIGPAVRAETIDGNAITQFFKGFVTCAKHVFVAKNPEFVTLAREIAMQVASMDPATVEELAKQPYIRDPARTIQEFITDYIAKLGENIVVKRFSRFEV